MKNEGVLHGKEKDSVHYVESFLGEMKRVRGVNVVMKRMVKIDVTFNGN